MSDLDFDVTSTEEATQSMSRAGGGRGSEYEPVAEKYTEIDKENEAIKLSGLANNDVQNIRNLLYRRFGKEDVIVRSTKVSDDPEKYDAVVRKREGNEYLRNNGGSGDTSDEGDSSDDEGEAAPSDEDVEEPSDDELDEVF